ncbi:MAG: rod shape-determining protein [Gammaproteobacteria bacterium]|nr:rod shape-determining protein [Gammaproteobacteria bacterium]
MIFEKIVKKFSTILYVQIWENRIKVTDIVSGNIYDEKPLIATQKNNKGEVIVIAVGNSAELIECDLQTVITNPFSHPRTLLSNFMAAEKVLQHIIHTLLKNKFFSPSPLTVIHPMEKIDGGITQIEFQALRELAFGAGSREVVVYYGSELNVNNFNYEEIKKNERQPSMHT